MLDVWPLGRWRRPSDIGALLLEKAPFLALALASGGLTVLAHSRGGHLASVETLPLELRLANALWSPVVYLQMWSGRPGLRSLTRILAGRS